MIIKERPIGICFSGMLPKLQVIADSAVDISLSVGGEELLLESYVPDSSGSVSVELRGVVEQSLSFVFPTSDVFEQKLLMRTFHVSVTELGYVEEFDFTAIRGGLKALSITTELWLQGNFLTWQPQEKRVEYGQPEWLTFYASEALDVHVTAYYRDIAMQKKTLLSVGKGKVWTVNVSFGLLSALFGDINHSPVYFDVCTFNVNSQRSYVQRYILGRGSENSATYVFENSLGGVDSVVFEGMERRVPEFEEKTARYEDLERGYDVSCKDVTTHQTGYISRYEAMWLRDLFGSPRKYRASSGALELILTESVNYQVDSNDDLICFEWSYRLGRETRYMALDRSYGSLPSLLEIPASGDEVYFIAPRLLNFPEATLNASMLFAVQSPFEEKWYRLNYGELLSKLAVDIKVAVQEIHWIKL